MLLYSLVNGLSAAVKAAGVREMAYYQQTLIIPKPRQRFNEPYVRKHGGMNGEKDYRNSNNSDLNTILAFFD